MQDTKEQSMLYLHDVDLMELTDSQEKLCMESLEVFAKNTESNETTSSTVMKSSTRTIERKSSSAKLPTFNFHRVGQVHIHYH